MSNAPPDCVVDASALLALFRQEPGSDVVEVVLERSAISSVNWSEVCRRVGERGVNLKELRADTEALGLAIVAFTTEDAEQAAVLWEPTRRLGLSLADRACLGLARRLGVPALTADRAWLELELGVQVQAIR